MASGDQTITGTSANEHLNGGSGSDTINGGGGDDFINAGSGNDVADGGSGSDRVDGGSGSDVLIYRQSENIGATDTYDGGSGIDTIRLELTRAQWLNATLQADIAEYLQFLAANTLPNGQAKNTEFRFDAFDLRVSKIENLVVVVDGVVIDVHAPVAFADTNGLDAVVESGVNPGNTPYPGDPSATGNVLTNDTDVDAGDVLSVAGVIAGNAAGPLSGNVGTTVTGTYGSLTLNANGGWTYTLNNADGDTNALAQGESASDVFSYTASDGNGGNATTTLTIALTGTNDQPAITGTASGSVVEAGTLPGMPGTPTATGQLNSGDPDHGAQDTWTVVGGSAPHAADYVFAVDNLSIVKNGDPTPIFNDGFGDGIAPPNSPSFSNGNPHSYGTSGTFSETGGRTIMDGTFAGPALGVGTPDEFVGHFATVRSNIDPNDMALGLKSDDDFTVEGRFDLTLPDDRREAYGIRLTDRLIGGTGPNVPPDQAGDDGLDLVVRMGNDGTVRVQLVEVDFANDQYNILGGVVLNPPAGVDQIVLRLSHDNANLGTITASFDLLDGGVLVGTTQTLSVLGKIFGTETPGFTGDDENWTRAQIVAYAPEESDSVHNGIYGSLAVNQAGRWTYALANNQPNVQALAQGDIVYDTFQVQVTDEHGATDTQTVTIEVTGTNDAASISGDTAGTLTEDDTTAVTGTLTVTDPDHDESHTQIVTNGAGLAGLGTFSVDANGHWSYIVDNTLVQYLNADQFATDSFVVNSLDGTALETVTLTITGEDEVPAWQPRPANAIAYGILGGANIIQVAPDGSLTETGIHLSNGGAFAYSTAIADVNADGYQDVLVTGDNGSGHLHYNDGDGTFSDSGQLFPGQFQARVSAGDIDNDGDLDVYFGNILGPSVLYQNNDGIFSPVFSIDEVGSSPPFRTTGSAALFGDLNGDGFQDLYIPISTSDKIFFNDGAGHFTGPGIVLPIGDDGGRVQLGDVNNDGALDIVRTPVGGGAAGVLVNDGAGNFSIQQATFGPASGSGLLLGDIDGNGTLDAVTMSGPGNGGLEWWSNDGTGNFIFAATLDPGGHASNASIADFNQDGHADIAYTGPSPDTINTLINDGTGQFPTGGTLAVSYLGIDAGFLFYG